jgi:hypothetical protein
MNKFFVYIWCPDCNGIDPDGCFGGEHERCGPFDTYDEAKDAAIAEVGETIWKYEIVGDLRSP